MSSSSLALPASETASEPAAFPFNKLPLELQEHILSYTVLTPSFQPVGIKGSGYRPQGVWIKSGQIQHPHASFFCVSHLFSLIARRFLFRSDNRFIFSGNPNRSLEWLLRQPRAVLDRITKLDLLLEWDDFVHLKIRFVDGQLFTSDGRRWSLNEFARAWVRLVGKLPKLFDISKLSLTIDAAFLNFRLIDDVAARETVSEKFSIIVYALLLRKQHFSRLACCHIYLPIHRYMEKRYEQTIMGKDYNSQDHGKIPFANRDPRLPHGFGEWETEDLDWHTMQELRQKRGYVQRDYMSDLDIEGEMSYTWNCSPVL